MLFLIDKNKFQSQNPFFLIEMARRFPQINPANILIFVWMTFMAIARAVHMLLHDNEQLAQILDESDELLRREQNILRLRRRLKQSRARYIRELEQGIQVRHRALEMARALEAMRRRNAQEAAPAERANEGDDSGLEEVR